MQTGGDMNQEILRYELQRVAERHQKMKRSLALAIGWALLAVIGAGVLLWARAGNHAVPGIVLLGLVVVGLLLVPILRAMVHPSGDHSRIAHWIEKRYRDLDTRL